MLIPKVRALQLYMYRASETSLTYFLSDKKYEKIINNYETFQSYYTPQKAFFHKYIMR